MMFGIPNMPENPMMPETCRSAETPIFKSYCLRDGQ